MPSRRPIVVLSGWLGCQPRSLRRYAELYKGLGLDVVTFIATPHMVVGASQFSPFLSEETARKGSIQALSWDIFQNVQERQFWFFHAFSNGGCFVWEQLRMIVEHQKATQPSGVIFDSSPANYHGKDNLSKALAYCSWTEQAAIRLQILWGGAQMRHEREARARLFWSGLCHDEWNTRQLYLCSHDDDLTHFEDLIELVRHRQVLLGKDRVWLKDWQSSPHCTHLLKHPESYRLAVETFVDHCLHEEKIRSRI
jgi:Eukaryotic protein of unknown function (DUF829)